MADLNELKNTLENLYNEEKSAKLYLFGKIDGMFRSGNILINKEGLCYIAYAQHNLESALQELSIIKYEKILIMSTSDQESIIDSNDPFTISLDILLHRLAAPVVADDIEGAFTNDVIELEDSDEIGFLPPEPEPSPPTQSAALDTADAVELLHSCRNLMQKYYGSGAFKKLDEINMLHSPQNQPAEFLEQCQELLVAMVGHEKAKKMITPLREKFL